MTKQFPPDPDQQRDRRWQVILRLLLFNPPLPNFHSSTVSKYKQSQTVKQNNSARVSLYHSTTVSTYSQSNGQITLAPEYQRKTAPGLNLCPGQMEMGRLFTSICTSPLSGHFSNAPPTRKSRITSTISGFFGNQVAFK